jgi:hypothetical protein
MEHDALVSTANAPPAQEARMRLVVNGLLGIDDAIDPARLVDALLHRGWQVGINQERPIEASGSRGAPPRRTPYFTVIVPRMPESTCGRQK